MSFVVALLGAESTGKTTLAQALAAALRADGHQVAVVTEYLREFCDAQGRTPRAEEQRAIAAEQMRRIAQAADAHELVIADTTGVMIAVYSELVFADGSLYPEAEAAHRATADLTLLTALDLPWQADGQRDGPHVREPVDAMVRAALARAGVGYAVVGGRGAQRLEAALAAIRHALAPREAPGQGSARWQWVCERCGDPACELHGGAASR